MQEAIFIWFDIFSCSQHKADHPGSAALVAHTSEVVAAARSVAVVLHPFDAPLALQRAWCVARPSPLIAVVRMQPRPTLCLQVYF